MSNYYLESNLGLLAPIRRYGATRLLMVWTTDRSTGSHSLKTTSFSSDERWPREQCKCTRQISIYIFHNPSRVHLRFVGSRDIL